MKDFFFLLLDCFVTVCDTICEFLNETMIFFDSRNSAQTKEDTSNGYSGNRVIQSHIKKKYGSKIIGNQSLYLTESQSNSQSESENEHDLYSESSSRDENLTVRAITIAPENNLRDENLTVIAPENNLRDENLTVRAITIAPEGSSMDGRVVHHSDSEDERAYSGDERRAILAAILFSESEDERAYSGDERMATLAAISSSESEDERPDFRDEKMARKAIFRPEFEDEYSESEDEGVTRRAVYRPYSEDERTDSEDERMARRAAISSSEFEDEYSDSEDEGVTRRAVYRPYSEDERTDSEDERMARRAAISSSESEDERPESEDEDIIIVINPTDSDSDSAYELRNKYRPKFILKPASPIKPYYVDLFKYEVKPIYTTNLEEKEHDFPEYSIKNAYDADLFDGETSKGKNMRIIMGKNWVPYDDFSAAFLKKCKSDVVFNLLDYTECER